MGDAKNNEIAMFELGTNHTKLWRSSKNEWFGGTEGFYWGDNNAKDLDVRLEYEPDPQGSPDFVPYVPMSRDLAWQKMYEKYRGKIDEQFAFLAFRSAPLVSASTMDAKVVTADMASKMMVWAEFGKPNQTPWVTSERHAYAKNDGLYPSGYRLFTTEPPPSNAIAAMHKLEPAAHHLTRPLSGPDGCCRRRPRTTGLSQGRLRIAKTWIPAILKTPCKGGGPLTGACKWRNRAAARVTNWRWTRARFFWIRCAAGWAMRSSSS